jgi:hypothetical protein
MPRKKAVEVRPCPFCGEDGPVKYDPEEGLSGLYLGPLSAERYGVGCYTCGAAMRRHVPDAWGRCRTYEGLTRATLKQAIESWNRRAPAARERGET